MAAAADDVEFRCFVGGLARSTTNQSLEEAFSRFGEVIDSKVINDRDTGRSRGFGFVTFKDEQSMRDAIERMNGHSLDGRNITVNEAQSRESGGGGRGFRGGRREGGGCGRRDGGGDGNSGGGGGYIGPGGSKPKKPPPVENKLPCSLKELYTGSTRKMKISRTVLDANGRLLPETEILTIDVKPGWKKGTKITFPDKGNEALNQLPADLVFVIDEKPHSVFKRDSNDLIMNYKVSLADALDGCTVNINTLDGRALPITVNDIVSPGYELVVHGEGMPIAKEPGNRGNLKVIFEVKFPKRLTAEQRAAVRRALGG